MRTLPTLFSHLHNVLHTISRFVLILLQQYIIQHSLLYLAPNVCQP